MPTKVSAFCNKIIEAGWLLALAVVPLFFNIYSNRVFEPDKLGLLRSIATLMAVAWLIKWAEQASRQEDTIESESSPKQFWRIPLVAPTLVLVFVYLLSTVASIVPRTSLWGSYQRLQGTYTTFSYIVIFALMLQHLRRPEQLRRLLATAIFTSLPISLYALVQHYGLDPLPWGGDVTRRVASNMGNPIFVSAYVIMILPLTLARVLQMQSTALPDVGWKAKAGLSGLWVVTFATQLYAWIALGFDKGLLAGLFALILFVLVGVYFKRPLARFLLLGGYTFVLGVQLVCILFSGSRGPWLGIIGGLFFFGLLYICLRRWRAVAISLPIVTAAALAFLVLINLPDSPLAAVREVPYVGRLGHVLEVDSGTGKVRVLIWQGAVDLVESDPWRTLVGYGPESMYVAYNPFYPPELAHYEARNASPDRSHNETFDSLISTGLLGFIAYVFLFLSIFYYGLSWLGLIRSKARKRLFCVCSLVGTAGGVIVPLVVDRSLRFAGVGLPMGLMVGLSAYVMILALMSAYEKEEPDGPRPDGWRLLLLIALVSAIVSHFIEINFGIATAATRTYFWAFAALVALLGRGLVSPVVVMEAPVGGGASSQISGQQGHQKARRKSRRRRKKDRFRPGSVEPVFARPESFKTQLVAAAIIAGFILATLAWDYTTNAPGYSKPLEVLVKSLTVLRGSKTSVGMLWMVIATVVSSLAIFCAEIVESEEKRRAGGWWLTSLGLFLLIAGGISGVFALIHASNLTPGSNTSTIVYEYYVWLFLLLVALASTLYLGAPRPAPSSRGFMALGYPLLLLACFLFVDGANISTIKADVLYKQGLKFDQERSWDNAIYLYGKATEIAPQEDFYRLFSGRAIMERGKLEKDAELREVYFSKALEELEKARELNPLNTDHTANIARLYRTWGEMESDGKKRREKFEQSLEYYEEAHQLSPHNAQIINEWGLVLHLLGDLDLAMDKYDESLALDPEYEQTYVLIGDVYFAREEWAQALASLEKAVALDKKLVYAWSRASYAYSKLGEMDKAIDANLQVLKVAPKDYVTLKNLSLLYSQENQPTDALAYAERALKVAPEAEKTAMENFVNQLKSQTGG